jgi:hypothetical protein
VITLVRLCRPSSLPAGRQGGDIFLSTRVLHRMPAGMVQAQQKQSHMPTLQSKQPGPVLPLLRLAAMQRAMHERLTIPQAPMHLRTSLLRSM